MISNCGGDENGKAYGGKAGDQTGNEWRIIPWYGFYQCVLRHPDPKVREMIALYGERAANNDNIGYDQLQRVTYLNDLAAVGYDPAKITKPTEADCSSGVVANVIAVGKKLGKPELANMPMTSTHYMRSTFLAAGFEILTDAKYLNSDAYLLRGDILLHDTNHTATNLTDGSWVKIEAVAESETTTEPVDIKPTVTLLKRGAEGQLVKNAQALLFAHGYMLNADGENDWREIDGEFGNRTYLAVVNFQRDHGLEVDGIVGEETLAALNS